MKKLLLIAILVASASIAVAQKIDGGIDAKML